MSSELNSKQTKTNLIEQRQRACLGIHAPERAGKAASPRKLPSKAKTKLQRIRGNFRKKVAFA
jgi:DnaJ-domain-containing protein 1